MVGSPPDAPVSELQNSFRCSECSKCFKKKCYLNSHMKIHSDEKPYKCGSCKNSFKDPSAFGRHKKRHLENFERFVCELCNKEFKSYSSFFSHKGMHNNHFFLVMFVTKLSTESHSWKNRGNVTMKKQSIVIYVIKLLSVYLGWKDIRKLLTFPLRADEQ